MSTNLWNTSLKSLLFVSLGLLAAASPAWAVTRSAKRSVKPVAAEAKCSTGNSSATADSSQAADADCKLGTAVSWMKSPDEAAKAAGDQDKLVFMIQVSGNFARQEFT
jgi:hypothetical protein